MASMVQASSNDRTGKVYEVLDAGTQKLMEAHSVHWQAWCAPGEPADQNGRHPISCRESSGTACCAAAQRLSAGHGCPIRACRRPWTGQTTYLKALNPHPAAQEAPLGWGKLSGCTPAEQPNSASSLLCPTVLHDFNTAWCAQRQYQAAWITWKPRSTGYPGLSSVSVWPPA